jgi:hypothetical protein
VRRIFVVGCPRSGTTLIQSIIAAAKGMTSYTESHFFDKSFVNLGFGRYIKIGDLGGQLRRFLEENDAHQTLLTERVFTENTWDTSNVDRIGRRFVRLLDEMAVHRKSKGWIEKTPDHLFRINLLQKLVPDAKFVHVVRNPRDTIRSLYHAGRQWGKPRSYPTLMVKWFLCVRISRKYAQRIMHKIVFYEDFVDSPATDAKHLLEWLDIRWDPDILDRYQREAASITSSGETWKRRNQGVIERTDTSPDTQLPYASLIDSWLNPKYEMLRLVCGGSRES